MKKVGKFRFGVIPIRGMFGLGVVLHWDMRVLSVQVGPWSFEVEGPQ